MIRRLIRPLLAALALAAAGCGSDPQPTGQMPKADPTPPPKDAKAAW